MADGTRSQDWKKIEENLLKKMDENLRVQIAENRKSMMEEFKEMMSAILTKTRTETSGSSGRTHDDFICGEGEASYQLATRFTKLDFPKFDGTDLQGWLFRCEQFFQIDNTPAHSKVKLASLHLSGKALEWHQSYVKLQGGESNWEHYEKAVKARFSDKLYEDPMADLKRLNQTGSLIEYIEAFDACAHKTTLAEDNILSCFLTGLTDEIGYPVLMQGPKTLQQAYALARM